MPESVDMLLVGESASVEGLSVALESEGFRVECAWHGHEAVNQFALVRPQLVVLETTLTGTSGVEVCLCLPQLSSVPIILLTEVDEDDEVVTGLDAGTDDVVIRPYRPRELLARMRALMRSLDCCACSWRTATEC
jgi:DNA-binding response OmpR family regulator